MSKVFTGVILSIFVALPVLAAEPKDAKLSFEYLSSICSEKFNELEKIGVVKHELVGDISMTGHIAYGNYLMSAKDPKTGIGAGYLVETSTHVVKKNTRFVCGKLEKIEGPVPRTVPSAQESNAEAAASAQ